MLRAATLVMVSIVAGTACGDISSSRGESSLPTTGVPAAPSDSERLSLDEWEVRLTKSLETVRIGTLNDPSENYVVGEVSDALVVSNEILVLDRKYHTLRAYGMDGRHLYNVGRVGRGPGEFMQPSSMEVMGDGRLVVIDGARRAQVFERSSGGMFDLVSSSPTVLGVESSCLSDHGFLLHGGTMDMRNRVYVLDLLGGPPHSAFAPVLPVVNDILQRRRSLGHMDCAPPGRSGILLTSDYFSDVQRFDGPGTAIWSAAVPDFIPMEFTIVDGGGLRQGIAKDAGGFHRIVGAVVLDESTYLVQVGWQTAQASSEGLRYTYLRSHLFSASSGAALTIGTEIPLILRVDPEGFLATTELPFPQVLRFQFADGVPE